MKFLIKHLRKLGFLSNFEKEITLCNFTRIVFLTLLMYSFMAFFVWMLAFPIIVVSLKILHLTDNFLYNYVRSSPNMFGASIMLYLAIFIVHIWDKILIWLDRRNDAKLFKLIHEPEPSIFSKIWYGIRNKVCIKIDLSKYD